MTNGGAHGANLAVTMAMFDDFPKPVRDALNYAPIKLGSDTPRKWLHRYNATECAMNIEQRTGDIMHSGHEDGTLRYWTPDHPQASREIAWSYHLKPRRAGRVRGGA